MLFVMSTLDDRNTISPTFMTIRAGTSCFFHYTLMHSRKKSISRNIYSIFCLIFLDHTFDGRRLFSAIIYLTITFFGKNMQFAMEKVIKTVF